jgi:hypothetical protein
MGERPLHLAVVKGNRRVVAWLLAKSVDVDPLAASRSGQRDRSPLVYAIMARQVKSAQLLVRAGAEFDKVAATYSQDIPSLEMSARALARKEHVELELSPAPKRTPSTERVAPVKTASMEALSDSFHSHTLSPGQTAEYEEELGVHIGDQCMVEARNFHGVAIIRYVGPCNKRTGLWIGLELPEPVGRNDGKLEARRYFTCLPNCGLFVRPEKITKLTS